MTDEHCREMRLLIQAELDGELDMASAATLVAHVAACPGCARERRQMSALSSRLRDDLTYYAAPAALRQSLEARLAAERRRSSRTAPTWRRRIREAASAWRQRLGFGTGALAGAAVLATAFALVVWVPRGNSVTEQLVADHIRALQPGHLMDVVSTDEHTVKPWFDGRLDFSPPVQDFAAQGFPLLGGRLDYLGQQPVAALVYARAKHVIDLYVWPIGRSAPQLPASAERNGYHLIHWTQGGMSFTAISDVAEPALRDFVKLWTVGGTAGAEEPK
jgi:anti-sigma factor RsiW